jgi:hypothetical protein
MRDDLDVLVEVIVNHDEIAEHEERFRNLNDIFKGSFCAWLKVLDTVVGHITDGAACTL